MYDRYPQYFGKLALDPPEKPAAPVVKAEKYKVRNGDTLWEIAQKFGTSIRTLMEMNKLEKPLIYAGQMLMVR